MVHFHESFHMQLARANSTDLLAGLFSRLLSEKRSILSDTHREAIERFVSAVTRSSVIPHEAVATFLGMVMYSRLDREAIQNARQALPESYQSCLAILERAIGSVESNSRGINFGYVFPTVLAAGIAAMSIDFRHLPFSLNRLNDWSQFIEQNTPNDRFATMTEDPDLFAVDKLPEPVVTMLARKNTSHKENEWLCSNLQALFWSRLRQRHPSIKFLEFADDRVWYKRCVDDLETEGATHGYYFKIELVSPPPVSVIADFSAQIEIPGIPHGDPLDASLVNLNYREGSRRLFRSWIAERQHLGIYVCAHIVPRSPFARTRFRRLPLCECWSFISSSHVLRPPDIGVMFVASFEEVLQEFHRLGKGSVVLKVDERVQAADRAAIAKTGHLLVVLLYDSSPQHILDIAAQYLSTGKVTVISHAIEIASYRVIIIKPASETWFFLAPTTDVGFEVVNHEFNRRGIDVMVDTESIERFLGSSSPLLRRVALSSYCT